MDGVGRTGVMRRGDQPYEVLIEALGDAEPPRSDDRAAPWESSMQATCDCLATRGALDTVERRNAEDELGPTIYGQFPAHARPAVATAHLLMDRGLIAPGDLQAKMAEVRARFERTE